jgi:hypothetical protein
MDVGCVSVMWGRKRGEEALRSRVPLVIETPPNARKVKRRHFHVDDTPRQESDRPKHNHPMPPAAETRARRSIREQAMITRTPPCNPRFAGLLRLCALVITWLVLQSGAMADDPPPPKTVIVVPQEDALVENSQAAFFFEGTAVAPESTVAAVQWRNNGGSWQDANGTDYWDFVATELVVGPNLIEVRSRNAEGTNGLAVSRIISRKPTWGIACDEPTLITDSGVYGYDLTYFPEAWHVFQAPAHGIVHVASTNLVQTAYCNNGTGGGFLFLHSNQYANSARRIIYEGQTLLMRSTRLGEESPVGELSITFEPGTVQPQDTCATAREITGPGSYHFYNGGEFSNPCHPLYPPEVNDGERWGTVWYRFKPQESGIYKFALRQNPTGEGFNVIQTTAWFFLFPGDGCELECEDSIPWETSDTGGLLEAEAGTSYLIALTNIYIDGWIHNTEGYGVLDVSLERPADTGIICSEATPITEGGVIDFNTIGAMNSDPCRPTSPTQWFTYTSPGDGVILVETCGLASFDTFLSVYKGDCPTACTSRVAINDDAAGPCGLQSRVEFAAQEGETYKIALSGFGNEAGAGQFLIDFIDMDVMVGDVVGTGTVTVSDVTALANLIANGTPPPIYLGDINADGTVNQADVQTLAEMIVNNAE